MIVSCVVMIFRKRGKHFFSLFPLLSDLVYREITHTLTKPCPGIVNGEPAAAVPKFHKSFMQEVCGDVIIFDDTNNDVKKLCARQLIERFESLAVSKRNFGEQ
ncbi:hypothetical protein VIBNIFTn2_280101 [Vibrio nigripulchritudo FTn2]|nr:hypothetical protein VIBNIFTn2_280101 [Vibrio nigripulchritudo FTn2]